MGLFCQIYALVFCAISINLSQTSINTYCALVGIDGYLSGIESPNPDAEAILPLIRLDPKENIKD